MKLDSKTEFRLLIEGHLAELGLTDTIRPILGGLLQKEVAFHNSRKWRFDFAIPDMKLAFEYEGRGKGHLSWDAYAKDCEKYAWAALLGWTVIRITANMVADGRAGPLIRNAINFSIDPGLAAPFNRFRVDEARRK